MRFFHLRFKFIFLFVFLDAIAVFFSIIAGYYSYFIFPFICVKLHPIIFYIKMGIFIVPLMVVVLYVYGLYKYVPSPLNINEFEKIIRAIIVGFSVLFMLTFFLNIKVISRMILLLSIGYSILFVSLFRYFVLKIEKKKNIYTTRVINVLIYGATDVGRELLNQLVKTPRITYNIIGFIDDEKEKGYEINSGSLNYPCKAKVLGSIEDIETIIKNNKIDTVFIALPKEKYKKIEDVYENIMHYIDSVFYVPLVYHVSGEILSVAFVGSLPLIGSAKIFFPLYYRILKRVMDIVLSLFALILLSPVLLLLMLIIGLYDGFPIIFKQKRIGKRGREFCIYKFRTMRKNVNPYGITPSTIKDERITPIGRILRKTGLDELPQLLNVLKGEMSLVGPRPEMPFIVKERKEKYYKYRFSVNPGITGLWQISKDRHLQIHENLEYDIYYVQNANIFMDLAILILTAFSFNKGV